MNQVVLLESPSSPESIGLLLRQLRSTYDIDSRVSYAQAAGKCSSSNLKSFLVEAKWKVPFRHILLVVTGERRNGPILSRELVEIDLDSRVIYLSGAISIWLGAMNGLKAITDHTFRNPNTSIPIPKDFASILHDCIHNGTILSEMLPDPIMNDCLRSYISHMINIVKGYLQALESKMNLRFSEKVVSSIDPALVRYQSQLRISFLNDSYIFIEHYSTNFLKVPISHRKKLLLDDARLIFYCESAELYSSSEGDIFNIEMNSKNFRH